MPGIIYPPSQIKIGLTDLSKVWVKSNFCPHYSPDEQGAITPTHTLLHQSTLSLSGRGADYAHHWPPNFLDLPTTLIVILTEHGGGLNVGGLCLGKKCAFVKEG